MNITIRSIDKPYNSPVTAILAEASADLYANGFDFGTGSIGWDCRAFYADVDGDIVGVLAWKISDWSQEASIELGYVKPAFRRRGIYNRLFEALEAEAINLKLRSIYGVTHANNKTLQAVAEQQGRTLVSLGYRKQLTVHTSVVSSANSDLEP